MHISKEKPAANEGEGGRMKKLDTRKEVGERMRKWDVRYKETKLKGELRWGNGNFGTKNEKWVSE